MQGRHYGVHAILLAFALKPWLYDSPAVMPPDGGFFLKALFTVKE